MIKPSIKIVFSLLIIDFFLIMLGMFVPRIGMSLSEKSGPVFILLEWGILFLLGIALTVLTVKNIKENPLRKFLLTVGVSTIGFPIFAILHNLTCALLSLILKKEIEEPVFFILAVIVCPVTFLIGTIGSAVLLCRKRKI